jgi:hypothetical protein
MQPVDCEAKQVIAERQQARILKAQTTSSMVQLQPRRFLLDKRQPVKQLVKGILRVQQPGPKRRDCSYHFVSLHVGASYLQSSVAADGSENR